MIRLKKAMCLVCAMVMMFSTTVTSYAYCTDVPKEVTNTDTSETRVLPANRIVYAEVYDQIFSGYTSIISVTPPKGSKLMGYVTHMSGPDVKMQIRKKGGNWNGISITHDNASYTKDITLISNCDGSTYEIRFYTLGIATLCYMIEAQY